MSRLNYVSSIHSPTLGELPIKEGSTTFKPNGYTREYLAGERSVDGGYTEKPEPAVLETTLQSSASIDLAVINTLTHENLTLRLSSGETWLMSNAWVSNQQELSKGEINVSFVSNLSEKL